MIYPIRVSGLGQLMNCPGSWLLQAMHPEPADALNEAAAEGTAAHEIAAEILRAKANITHGKPRDALSYVGHVASNGVTLTRGLCESVAAYIADVDAVIMRTGKAHALKVEEPIEVIPELLGGTPDAWLYDGKTIYVWDFKSGHNPVEAFENWQLLGYLVGIIKQLKIDGLADQYLRADLRIVQPRAQHRHGTTRSWSFMLDEARGYANRIEAECNTVIAAGQDAPTRNGPHCLYCSARGYCETSRGAAARAIEVIGSATSIPFDPAAAAYELELLERAIEAAKTRQSGLIEVVEAALRSGQQVAEFVLEPSYGRTTWNVPDDQLFLMFDAIGVNVRKVSPLTPTQAKSAGANPDVVDNLIERPRTGFTLVRTDKANAKQFFSNGSK